MLILKIVGVIALLVVAAVVAGVIWLWRAAVREAAAATPYPPARISLEREEHPVWRNESQVMKYAADFRAAGFEEIGVFTIPEMGALHLLAFVHLAERFYACIYDHKKLAPSFDICGEFADRTELTGCNTAVGESIDKRPGDIKLHMPNESVKTVFNALREYPKAAERLPVTREGFAETFKREYARTMNWSMSKGGISREEIRRQAQQDKRPVTDEQLEEVYKEMRASYVEQLQKGCIAQYLDEAKLPIVEWERIQHRTLAVPETLTLEEIAELFETTGCLDEEQRHALTKVETSYGENGLDLLKRIIAGNVGALGLKEIAQISEPVRAAIVLLPDDDAPWVVKAAA